MGLKSFYFKNLARVATGSFGVCEKLGFYIIHRSYYSAIPDTRRIARDHWDRPRELVGVDLRRAAQMRVLDDIRSASYRDEIAAFPARETEDPNQFYYDNRSFGPGDFQICYHFVRSLRPKRIIEIGSGHSSKLIAHALRRNSKESGTDCDYTVIDPLPCDAVRAGLPGVARLLAKPVQDVPVCEFEKLGADDILFIDSSHVVKVGSDTQYELLEILPRLKAGVYVHFHDILLPEEYPRDWIMKRRRFWNEQYVLQAFLTFNHRFEVIWAGHYMRRTAPDEMEAALPTFKRTDSPGSFWIRSTQ